MALFLSRLSLSALLLGALYALPAVALQQVRVSGAHFPPYLFKSQQHVVGGLLPQLLEALNQEQDEFEFMLLPTSLPRRFRAFEQGRIDMAIFENPAWGWQGIEHRAVDMGLEDAEVFVARAASGRGQDYFDSLRDKRLALYNGYHYGFAGFNAEPVFLARAFDSTLTYSHDSNLSMVLRKRADIALMTRSYLNDYLARHSEHQDRLLVSERVDQHYRHQALLRPQSPISPRRFAVLMQQLRASGRLNAIFDPYQIRVRPPVTDSASAQATVMAQGQGWRR
ncbi:MAG: transporter substrate-binding domain-containing protein [Pseudomonadota bacterium]